MKRRSFLKQAIWVPTLFAIRRASGQVMTVLDGAFVGSVNQPAEAGTPASFTDNFTRANADPMSDPASGGTWTVGHGAFNAVKISINTCVASAANVSGARVLTPSFSADQRVDVTAGGAINGFGPTVRNASTSDGDCYVLYADTTTVWSFYKVTDSGTIGVARLGATYTHGSAVTAGTVVGLSASGTGTVMLEGFIDGVSIGTRTDSSSPYDSGQPGIYINGLSKSLTLFEADDL